MKIRAAVTDHNGAPFEIQEVELASPKDNEVLVKLAGVGLCPNDYVASLGGLGLPMPAVMGHEGSGVVVEVGKNVKRVAPGDHVVLTFYTCGTCEHCRSGHPTTCSTFDQMNLHGGVYPDGTKRITLQDGREASVMFCQGSFAEYAVTTERNCIPVDKSVDIALLGPLGCGLQAGAGTVANKLKPPIGSTIAIFGCGPIGLCALMMARNAGCSKIIAVDAMQDRIELAKELGATNVVTGDDLKDIPGAIRAITGEGTDYAVDTTAVPDLVNAALYGLKPMGTLCVMGSSGPKVFPIVMQDAIMGPGKTLVGCVEGDCEPEKFIPMLVQLFKDGKFEIDKLITEYKFEEINQAFADMGAKKVYKPVIRF